MTKLDLNSATAPRLEELPISPADPIPAFDRDASQTAPRVKLKTDTLIGFILCHSLALLALFPWFFSWTGVALLAAMGSTRRRSS